MKRVAVLFFLAVVSACGANDAPPTEPDVSTTPQPSRDGVDGKADFLGEPRRIEDRLAGMRPSLDLAIVAELDAPPGNVTATDDGRIFFTFHPSGHVDGHVRVAELVGEDVVPYPNADFQRRIDSVLSLRVDRQERLWLLDHGDYGFGDPALYAIDLDTDEVVFEYDFSSYAAPLGSMLNDFQVSPDGEAIFISDQSPIRQEQAIVVVDLAREHPIARRRLRRHRTVVSGEYDVFVDDELVKAFGFVRPDYGVDSIALDSAGEWLYYASLNQGELYRIRAEDLRYEKSLLLDEQLRPEHVASIPLSDGIATDHAGNVYITSIEQNAVSRVTPDGQLELLAQDELLRWPDGLGWTPSGDLLVTASALQHVLPEVIRTDRDIAEHGPYHILRLTPQDACDPDRACFGNVGH